MQIDLNNNDDNDYSNNNDTKNNDNNNEDLFHLLVSVTWHIMLLIKALKVQNWHYIHPNPCSAHLNCPSVEPQCYTVNKLGIHNKETIWAPEEIVVMDALDYNHAWSHAWP